MGKTITLPGAPGTGELYGKAVTGMLPGVGKPARVPADAPLPDTHYRLEGVRVDPAALQAYCHATGQRFGATLPVTYPFVLQFPVVMKLLTSDEFPFGAIGSVHMTNKIERKRPIEVGEPANLTVVDPDTSWVVRGAELASLSRNTPFEEMTMPATITATVLRGVVTTREGRVTR